MLEEAVTYLREEYGFGRKTEQAVRRQGNRGRASNGHAETHANVDKAGWEILIVSDGSTDRTVETALGFARTHGIFYNGGKSPRSTSVTDGTSLEESLRVISLVKNRGKGGATTAGMRHVRGQYAMFADADGASKFTDLGKLIRECRRVEDKEGRGVAVGSRAHLVGGEAVVKVRFPHIAKLSRYLTWMILAIISPQPPDALLPPLPPRTHAARHRSDQRHSMRLQAILSPRLTIYHPLYALRRVDLRR
jgi:dolichyl-phosphate beta-glucosyltransferase